MQRDVMEMLASKALQKRYQPREKGKQPYSHERQLGVIRFSPDGKELVGGILEGHVCRWDATGEELKPLPDLTGHHGWVQALGFAPDGKRLFSADSWGKLCCWANGVIGWSVEAAHPGWIRQLAVSPDGKALATCGADGTVRLWSADKGQKQREFSAGLDVLAVCWHPDGKSIVFGDLKGGVHQHEVGSGKLVRKVEVKELYRLDRIQDVGGVRCLAFDAAGATLAVAGGQPATGGFVTGTPLLAFFETATGKLKQTVKIGTVNDVYIHDLLWHPGGFVMGVTSGQPGQGKLFFHQPGDASPFFITPKMANCHSLTLHGRRLVVSATNANSSGNGRPLTKEKKYPGNSSPLFTWELPAGA